MEAMGGGVLRHLVWRYRSWYQDEELLSHAAGPILGELMGQVWQVVRGDDDGGVDSTAGEGGGRRSPPLVVYSCHDVTILGLLYGIGADFVASHDALVEAGIAEEFAGSKQQSRWQVWPEYACTLLFELVRVRKESCECDGGTHVVRVVLNGKPVRVVSTLKKDDIKKTMTTTGDGIANYPDPITTDSYDIPLSDFARVIQELQNRGGLNAGDGTKEKRDMRKNDM